MRNSHTSMKNISILRYTVAVVSWKHQLCEIKSQLLEIKLQIWDIKLQLREIHLQLQDRKSHRKIKNKIWKSHCEILSCNFKKCHNY